MLPKCHPNRKYWARGLCKPCYEHGRRSHHIASTMDWIARNRERFNASNRKWYLRERYNLTVEQYQELYDAQGGMCALCRKAKKLGVDPDHETGRVRGLLCNGCNAALGNLGDTPEGLQGALDYLRRSMN